MKLRNVEKETWDELFALTTLKKFRSGAVIFFQGSEVEKLCILETGTCKLSHLPHDGGLERIFSFICGISVICASAHVCDLEVYPVTATACTDVTVRYIDWDKALNFISQRPAMNFFLLKSVSGEVVSSYNQFSDFNMDIRYRVARFLSLQGHYGMLNYYDYIQESEIHVSQEVIASILGVSRFSVNMALGELEEKGLIAKKYKKIFILSHKKLAEYCEEFDEET